MTSQAQFVSLFDVDNTLTYPPADMTRERISDLINYDLSAFIGAGAGE